MLEVGNGGMTNDEYIAHFSLWALAKSPLLIGCDITQMSNDTFQILTNQEVIAINQDPLGIQGKKISSTNNLEVWGGRIVSGAAIVLFNRSSKAGSITANFSDLGLDGSVGVRDLWKHKNIGSFDTSFSSVVAPHAAQMYRLISNS